MNLSSKDVGLWGRPVRKMFRGQYPFPVFHYIPKHETIYWSLGFGSPCLLTQNTDAKTHTVAQRVQVHVVNVA